ncbi:Holliday junction resolvase RuvX [uncultured Ferrovibrio sp.]|jgi:putative Holliday junction resolvase|uniref:Holliday junction resolvase RuvX n=1 Tax=uncultured Ferrovibrio sp. TaxID=1576913 RepID=UPI002605425A|nr:Holliday junction resolvase RuvX [uncultured Ferrovibrio sp.]
MPPGNPDSPPEKPAGTPPETAPQPARFRPAHGPVRLQPGQRYLGLDLGTKTIGLALSDAGHRIASPYATIQRRKFKDDAAELVRIAQKEGVAALVLGLPVNMDGSEGPRCQAARAFARNIAQHLPVPIALWDERMSTMAVQRMMTDEADLSRARRAELVDKLAASYILQAYLDWLTAQSDPR